MCSFLKYIACFIFINFAASSCPNGLIKSGLSQSNKDFALKKHNDLRQSVADGKVLNQPPAVDMKTMVWDEILASKAQKIAETCKFEHVNVNDDRWYWVGQNLAIQFSTSMSENYDWDSAIQGWFDEHKVYNYSKEFNPQAGHYTQLVWDDSDHLGCGATIYEKGSDMKYKKLYVCHYGPGGNIQGQYPYKTDE